MLTSVDSSTTKPKPKILSYWPSFKKSGEETGAKDERASLTPTVQSSVLNSDESLPARGPRSSQDFGARLTGSNDEARISADVSTKTGGGTHTFRKESPLKRPHESSTIPKPVEKRLKRPINSNEEIPYSDTVATFAVDVSGSTEGKVLEEEKEAIKTLCGGLSRDAFTQAEIIPWNEDVQPLIRANQLETLVSGGGTEPSRLNFSHRARTALSRCSAWFLLTDGEIGSLETQDFSQGICRTSLHGTPCVVILFGYKTARPVGCNISVGLSVFSNAADCLFLFHDIDTTQVYILQSKGVFNAILPSGSHELVLDSRTLWSDVPVFKYRQLFDLPLPARQNLQSDELLLQSRRKINLQDLYRNQLDSSTAGEILTNNDNLQSVLLAAQVRGDDDNLRNWISQQSLRGKNIILRERPDIDCRAAIAMRALLPLLARPNSDSGIFALQHSLRTAHHNNWIAFVSDLRTECHERSARSTVVSDVMGRITSNRREFDSNTNSPALLSPVSPVIGQPRIDPMFGPDYSDSEPEPPWIPGRSPTTPPSAPRLKHSHIPGPFPSATKTTHFINELPSEEMDSFDLRTLKSRLTGENAGALYIQHYRYRPGDPVVQGTCPICAEADVLLVFLLKSPPTDISTPNFPQPGDRKGLAYPLAMGTYPETDILSSQLACDSCAHTIVEGKMAYDGYKVTAAIPIIKSAFSGEYQSTTSRLIDTALEKRFQKSSIEFVFLSIIYSTLANLDGKNTELRSEALRKGSSWIADQAQLPPCLSMSITGSTPQIGPYGDPMPMIEVLKDNIERIEQPESPLLQYPIGGFVVLMLITTEFHRVTSVKACQLAVWHRFLFHLVEKHCALLANKQPQAILALQKVLTVSSADTDMDNGDERHLRPVAAIMNESREQTQLRDQPRHISMDSHTPAESKVPSIRLSTVCRTHLLSEEDLEEFQRLDNLFEPVENLCSAALHSFLESLSQQVSTPSLAIDVFDKMRAQANLHDIFWFSGKK